MTTFPDFNPYDALGVAKDATLPEIKSSHRKLVLKCHPDKIKDESLRSEAQDQFQKVQQAYELLSDETSRIKYDNHVKLAELKREMRAHSQPTPREYRESEGRYYEERVPADARSSNEAFFEDRRFTESPRPTSRKHEDYETRPRSRATGEKKKSKVPSSSSTRATRETRESTKESTKSTRADQDKYRTKERRRQVYEKKDYFDTCDSDSDRSETIYVKRPSESRRYRDHKSKPTESRRADSRRHDEDDDDLSDGQGYKHNIQYSNARDYIRRSKETININEPDRRHRSSRSPPPRRDSGEPEVSEKHSSRSKWPSRDSRPPTSRHGSFEHLDHPHRVREKVPSMPTAQTFPSPKAPSSSRPSHQSSNARSQSWSSKESSRPHYFPGTKMRSEKTDSGYASSSPTPENPSSMEASPKPPRYKSTRPDPVLVEPNPPPLRHARTSSPPRTHERRIPTRSSTTYNYPPDPVPSRRPPLYREVPKDARDVEYITARYPMHTQSYDMGRRQPSAYA
ncbi:hypothetical protein BJX99DRAFT_120791 [Aspergillus californicus]